MVYVFEVGYEKDSVRLPPVIKDIKADDPNKARSMLDNETPIGWNIRIANLIGSRKA
jgi:hypothetical protein